jgi:hypothetical protein
MKPIQHVISESFNWELDETPGPAGICGWCKNETPETFRQLPAAFLEYENLQIPADNARLCRLCMTSINGLKPVRWGHMLITQAGATMTHNPPDLYEWLASPIPPDTCVICNTNNQKRPLFNARWGSLATSYDGGFYNWDWRDTAKLAAVRELRLYGANENDLKRPAPKHKILIQDPPRIKFLWDQIKSWDPIRLECGILATRKPKNVDPLTQN